MSKQHLLVALAVYIVSAAGAFAAFSYFGPTASGSQTADTTTGGKTDGQTALGSLLTINPGEAKNQPCPLNGQMYTATEKAAWEKRRPLFVMIENTPDSRPQSGLSKADVVFEAVAEGAITRFGAMFYCGVQADDAILAPIRSARTYYIDWASGFNRPMYVHVGGANVPGPSDALGQLGDYGWNGQNDINQFSVGYPTFVRDYNRLGDREIATEHTMVTSTEKLWAVATKRNWTNMTPAVKVGKTTTTPADWKAGYKGWSFEDGKSAGTVSSISYEFWTGYKDYAVSWQYDSAKNAYARSQGGAPHTDLEGSRQIMASNVVILFTTEKGPINEKKHMLYGTTGKGEALVFKNGEAIKATWTKKDREGELMFVDAKGKDLVLNRGMVWVSVLATGSTVTY